MRVVLITGGFDPLHSGHISYIEAAKNLGNHLIVGLNSDEWLCRKKGKTFLPIGERKNIIKNLKWVTGILEFDDRDDTAKDAIRKVRLNYPSDTIIFANGGDRTRYNIPEMNFSDSNLEFVFGVGGEDKKNSSSQILENWLENKTERPWGYYKVLYSYPGVKVKELTVMPNCSLTMQRHRHRSEYWHVVEGLCDVYSKMTSGYNLPPRTLYKNNTMTISENEWHRLSNPYNSSCKIIEIQYGSYCEEDDIERSS